MSLNLTGRMPEKESVAPLRFTSADRITKTAEIRRLVRPGTIRARTTALEILAAPSLSDSPRIGVVVSKFGRNSVQRNLVKRRLKEIARVGLMPRLKKDNKRLDVLIRARRQAYGRRFSALDGEAKSALEKICSSK